MEVITEEPTRNTVPEGYRRTDFGLIPETWTVEKIGPKIDLLTGNPFSSSGYSDNGVRLLRCANIKRGNTDWSNNITRYWAKITPLLRKYKLQEDDVVIAMDGSLVGRSYAILKEDDLPALLLQRAARIRSELIDTRYLKYFVGSDWFVGYCDSVKTNTAVPHISAEDIRNFEIPLPPTLEEQQAIAEALSDVDALIAELDALIEKKQQVKKGAMQQLLTPPGPGQAGKKRLPGFDGEWEEYSLIDLADENTKWSFTGGPFGSDLKTEHYTEKGIRVIQLQNIGDGRFINENEVYTTEEKANELISNNIYPGEIILSKMGDPVARACIIPDIQDRYLMCSDGIRLKVDNKRFDTKFIHAYLNYEGFRERAESTSSGSTRKRIGLQNLKKLKVEAPSLEEQKAIANILSDMDAEIQALQAKRNKYQQIKQGMMQELLTGKTRLI